MADQPSYTERQERRSATLQRIANAILQGDVDKALQNTYTAIRDYMRERGIPTTRFQLSQLNKALNEIITSQLTEGFEPVTEQFEEVAVKEAGFAFASLAASGAPLVEKLRETGEAKVLRYVRESSMTLVSGQREQAGTWQDFVNDYTDSQSRAIQNLIRSEWNRGFEAGTIPTVNQLSRRVRSYLDTNSKNQAEALVRTGIVHYSNQANNAFRDDNLDVISKEYPIVMWDNRTSDTCISISARYGVKGWPVGKSPIGYPPYHYNCRTRIGYMTKGQKEPFGDRVALGGQSGEAAEEAFEGRKDRLRTASQVRFRGRRDLDVFKPEQIDAAKPIAKWLLSQPDWFIMDTLGKKKGQAFIRGELDLAKLTDRDLKPLNTSQLGID